MAHPKEQPSKRCASPKHRSATLLDEPSGGRSINSVGEAQNWWQGQNCLPYAYDFCAHLVVLKCWTSNSRLFKVCVAMKGCIKRRKGKRPQSSVPKSDCVSQIYRQ